jgi:tRNA1Val (adenine37-N6)-methyltransferase
LEIRQTKGGYRFSIDAFLLAGLTWAKPDDRVVDLGTGCGVVALILAYRGLGRSVVGVEIQGELATLAQSNVERNDLGHRVKVIHGDYRRVEALLPPQSADLVVSNPPYRRLRSGRINPEGQRALARHEIVGSAADACAAGRYLLATGGRLALVYPASRLPHLILVAARHGFAAKRLTVIYSRPNQGGRLIHLECRKDGGQELRLDPPIFVYDAEGSYSKEVRRLYAP